MELYITTIFLKRKFLTTIKRLTNEINKRGYPYHMDNLKE
jgi:hypothetical protein